MKQRSRASTAVAACLALVVLLPVLYVGGYFGLAQTFSGVTPNYSCRFYRWPWLAKIYRPAAKAEGWLTGGTVEVFCEDEVPPSPAAP